ncbi:MAG: hypothetical protein KIS30_04075 [Thermoplasmata archaeon]|nr:hypothetical protein [Candidatus Sysuiplasma acidicola]MBX8645922.1 hypothetical protein [Candidatus Sysuiplasma acidicola]
MPGRLSDEKLKNLLMSMPIGVLKRVLKNASKGRLEGVRMTSLEDIADAVVNVGIDEKTEEEILRLYGEIGQELEPETIHFVSLTKGQDLSTIETKLRAHPFNKESGTGKITVDGFDIENIEVTDSCNTVYFWYLSQSESLGTDYEVKSDWNNIGVGLTFNVDEMRIELRGKAAQASKALSFIERAVRIGCSYPNPVEVSAEQLEESFKKLTSRITTACNAQNSSDGRSPIEIRSMNFFYPTGAMSDKSFKGREDIFTHPDVRYEIDRMSAKVMQIGGVLTYKNLDFNFKVGFVRLFGSGKYIGVLHIQERGSGIGESSIKRDLLKLILQVYFGEFRKYFS